MEVEIDYLAIGKRIRTARLSKKMTQETLSNMIDVAPTYVSSIENGHTKLSLATLLGAVGTYLLRKHKFLCTLPPVIANMVIIPFVLRYGYGLAMEVGGHDVAIPFYMLTVGAGEVICCCILCSILLNALAKMRNVIFKNE